MADVIKKFERAPRSIIPPASMGMLNDVQAIVKERPDSVFEINLRNGFTALHYAARLGHTSMIALLVKAGSNLYAEDIHGRWPIDLAYGRGNQIDINIIEKATYPENRETRFDPFDGGGSGGAPVQPLRPPKP